MKKVLVILSLFSTTILSNQRIVAQANQPPYESLVPKFTFSNTLREQENELKANPLVKRFVESRKKLSTDRYRPLYHFVSPESTLNDPNGLCFWQGSWHMFYQGYPPEDRRQHWGHAISKDLIHWKDLPYAIYPGPERAVFSGSTLVEGNRVIAMYHGTELGNMVAVSDDPLLLNWDKVTGKAVIPMRSHTGFPLPYSVFDPSIWKKDGIYYSLSAGRAPKGPGGRYIAVSALFRSKDLANWEYMHEFVENDRFTLIGDDYACPYFWPIGDRYIMPFFSHMTGGQYLLGDYDTKGDKFLVTHAGKFNFGSATPSGVHAPSATPDGKGGVIVIFNMNPGKPTSEWNQIMTLPRRLTLVGTDDVRQEPAGDIESLRYNRQEVKPVILPANKEVVLQNINGNAMELHLEIDPKEASMLELNVLRSANKEEFTRIVFFKERGFHQGRPYEIPRPADFKYQHASLITIESSYSSLHPDVRPRGPETASFNMKSDETLKLRVFIDKSVVEVFVNGKQALAVRVYPSREDAVGVSVRSQGKDSELKSLEAWQMKSIYD
jgi:beta-fructofuranosidase